MPLYYKDDFLTTLAYMMGENSVNTTTATPRTDFIQNALKEAYQAYPWRFARANATLSIVSGLATLPADYDDSHLSFARFDDGSTTVDLTAIDPDDEYNANDGDRKVWIEAIGDGDRFILKTKDTDVATVRFRYQKQAPNLATASTGTPYFNKRTIAAGARRDVKLGQNPDADISQEQATFEKSLARDIAAHQVPAPRKKRKSAASSTGDW